MTTENNNSESEELEDAFEELREQLGQGPRAEKPEEGSKENEHYPPLEPEEPSEVAEFLQDDPPKGKVMFVKWALMHGKSEEQCIDDGCNPGTVRVAAQELEKDGYRKRPEKPQLPAKIEPGGGIKLFAKGSPPEALIDAIKLPVSDGELGGFEKGIKFGASMIILGVRVAQELSSVGIQQAKPLIDMSKSMREGEALAAKSAAGEAAMEAAGMVQQSLMPYLANISKTPAGADPMKAMMVRVMEPMMTNMMSKVLPGMAVGPENQLPEGWTKKSA